MTNRSIYGLLLLGLSLLVCPKPSLQAQNTQVDINPNVKRSIGGVSLLDRGKYFNMHSRGQDAEHQAFYQEYNVNRSGRGFWTPLAVAKQQTGQVGLYPNHATSSPDTSVRAVTEFVATDHPRNAYKEGLDIEAAADWVVAYYRDQVNTDGRPRFYEPMNEPFVHARDFYDEPDWTPSAEERVRGEMAELFSVIGAKIHEAPELANMMVIGYSSAYPQLERQDFSHWTSNQKMFMDVAGDNMDGFATHLYDGINVVGEDTRRSGSNSEAVLDLIETYSYVKWDSVKPHAVTEYGGIEKGYPDGYSDVKSIQSIRSINHILFNLLERQDKMLISIPFIGGKATWHINADNNYQPYGAVLWIPENIGVPLEQITGWEYTARINFYKLWQHVKGERVMIQSNNPDVQTQAFLDGKTLYVALNNLEEEEQVVDLNFSGNIPDLDQVNIRSLKIFKFDDPIYEESISQTYPGPISMVAGETVVLAYNFANPVTFENSIQSSKYYSKKHLQPILANQDLTFQFDAVSAGEGFVNLRMSIGRKHNRSKTPEIRVNGQLIATPTNWAGYDQADRDDFFGMIEIPVPAEHLQTNNTVSIKFPDSGGHISSLILEVEKMESLVATNEPKASEALPIQKLFPNPATDRLTVELPDAVQEKVNITFFDVSGKPVLQQRKRVYQSQLTTNVRRLPAGVYMVRITSSSNTYVGKLQKW
ncbi:MAG: T9SS type A sorting domain-containing protein [Saprospiraceae bacterium]|nr:T9SS type A sorting domain-containing protein [Saprospiraceae bacterium]